MNNFGLPPRMRPSNFAEMAAGCECAICRPNFDINFRTNSYNTYPPSPLSFESDRIQIILARARHQKAMKATVEAIAVCVCIKHQPGCGADRSQEVVGRVRISHKTHAPQTGPTNGPHLATIGQRTVMSLRNNTQILDLAKI